MKVSIDLVTQQMTSSVSHHMLVCGTLWGRRCRKLSLGLCCLCHPYTTLYMQLWYKRGLSKWSASQRWRTWCQIFLSKYFSCSSFNTMHRRMTIQCAWTLHVQHLKQNVGFLLTLVTGTLSGDCRIQRRLTITVELCCYFFLYVVAISRWTQDLQLANSPTSSTQRFGNLFIKLSEHKRNSSNVYYMDTFFGSTKK